MMTDAELGRRAEGEMPAIAAKYLNGPVVAIGVSRRDGDRPFEGRPFFKFWVDPRHPDYAKWRDEGGAPAFQTIEGEKLEVVVEELSGPMSLLQVHTRRERPMRPGASIGDAALTKSGTYGALVLGPGDGLFGLTAAHVLRTHAESANPEVHQPSRPDAILGSVWTPRRRLGSGAFVQDRSPDVDAALFGPLTPSVASAWPHSGVPAPSGENPAIGLLVAGDGTVSFYTNIAAVLADLAARFPADDAVAEAVVGMRIAKSGRTTGPTIGVVDATGVFFTVEGRTYVGFAARQRALIGDSGAVAVRWPDGDLPRADLSDSLLQIGFAALMDPSEATLATITSSGGDPDDFNKPVLDLLDRANAHMRLEIGAVGADRRCGGQEEQIRNPDPTDVELVDSNGKATLIVAERQAPPGEAKPALEPPAEEKPQGKRCCTFGDRPRVTIQGFEHAETGAVGIGPVTIKIDLKINILPVSGTFFRHGFCHGGHCGDEMITGTARALVMLDVKFEASAPIELGDLKFSAGNLTIARKTNFPYNKSATIGCDILRIMGPR